MYLCGTLYYVNVCDRQRAYCTALNTGNPLKMTKLIETAGLKWPPDVPAHTVMAKKMPKQYAKPTWSKAGTFLSRQAPFLINGRLTNSGFAKDLPQHSIQLRTDAYPSHCVNSIVCF